MCSASSVSVDIHEYHYLQKKSMYKMYPIRTPNTSRVKSSGRNISLSLPSLSLFAPPSVCICPANDIARNFTSQ